MSGDPLRPPRPVGSAPVEMDLQGMLLLCHGDRICTVQILRGPVAVPLFTTLEKLERAANEYRISFTSAKQITDTEEFLASVPPSIEVIIDPWTTPEGKVRYLQATGRLAPVEAQT